MARKNCLGFTLIELMVVVSIIGILLSIAYPSYTRYVLKSHRVDAQTVMLDAAQQLERCYTLNNSYATCTVTLRPLSQPGRYTITPTTGFPAQTFTLSAAPQGAQTADTCGTMTLAHTGLKTPATGCW